MTGAQIRVGIGGWTYEPWRETFYPAGLPRQRELEHASRQLTAIEVNGTFYRTQKPETFAKWRDETPEQFVFTLKAPRYATNRKVLAEAGPSIERFMESGLAELAHKLGPILWQLAPAKRFEPDDLRQFLALLPEKLGERRLRHALEVRHESFRSAAYVKLAREFGVATVFTDSASYPSLADLTGDFVYARLMNARESLTTGYPKMALDRWADRAQRWTRGEDPEELPHVSERLMDGPPRDAFLFFINGAKERAPGAARTLLSALR